MSFGKEKSMKPIWIPVLVATAAFSANAFADHRWDDDDDHCEHRHYRERVVVQRVYEEPAVVYQAPPQVIYQDRMVYRDRPVYYEAEPRYDAPPPPRYYEQQPAAYPAYGGNRIAGQAIGAVAGGVIGSRFGRGNGRLVSTAVGAVVGSVVGGNLSGY